MSSGVYYRLLGQTAVLIVHGVNSLVMFLSMQDQELMGDPEIKTMVSMQNLYITVWNIGFQISYFSLAFMCDASTIMGKDHMISKRIRKFRRAYFSALIWPIALFIFIIFWPIFMVNRELIFPVFIDKIFSFKSNLVIHLFIVPAAIWELIFLPRRVPTSHWSNIIVITALYIVYNAIIIYAHSQRGLWPYPILDMLYGTVYFYILLLMAYVLCIWCYQLQWRFAAMLWNKETSRIKIK